VEPGAGGSEEKEKESLTCTEQQSAIDVESAVDKVDK